MVRRRWCNGYSGWWFEGGGVMVIVSALSLGGWWFKPSQVIPKALKMVSAASLLDAEHLSA